MYLKIPDLIFSSVFLRWSYLSLLGSGSEVVVTDSQEGGCFPAGHIVTSLP